MQQFSFLVNVCNDIGKAIHLCREISWYFPETRCDIVFDGYEQQNAYDQFNWMFRDNMDLFVTHIGERLKPIQNGTKWITRYLEIFDKQEAEYLIKLDPDSEIARHFSEPLPEADYFGTIIQGVSTAYEHVQGGVKGISRRLVKHLIQAYINPQDYVISNKQQPHLISEDLTMMHTIKTLQKTGYEIIVKPWEEVCSFYRKKPLNPWIFDGHSQTHDRKYAITHPR